MEVKIIIIDDGTVFKNNIEGRCQSAVRDFYYFANVNSTKILNT